MMLFIKIGISVYLGISGMHAYTESADQEHGVSSFLHALFFLGMFGLAIHGLWTGTH